MPSAEEALAELIADKRKFIENLLVVENKQRQRVPFIYNDIQAAADAEQTGMDIWVKPSQVGFSTERIANRLVDTLTCPGTNTVLIAYEDFITERLLAKVKFFYSHLASLGIPNFPRMSHNSTYEKTFEFIVDGVVVSTSSIYIASARSKTAGRAETIHHLLLDEMAFYIPEARDNIVIPALDRLPQPGGTCDAFSTPNGEDNDFHDWYVLAKQGLSLFTPHFFPWFMHKEYRIYQGDHRLRVIPETDKPEFKLTSEEELLMFTHNLDWAQIRWRRWSQKLHASLMRKGEKITLFGQEFPENDVNCFMATGDQYYDSTWTDTITKMCHDPIEVRDDLSIWYYPEPGKEYHVIVDPGNAKMTQSAIGVYTFDKDDKGNICPRLCARDAGWYDPDTEYAKACVASDMYNRATLVWEANGHGLAFTILAKDRRPIYFRKDIVDGVETLNPGWYTSGSVGRGGTKDYMIKQVRKYLPTFICHDTELARQLRESFKMIKGKFEIIGMDDIHDTLAIYLSVMDPNPIQKGIIGQTGWGNKWGKKQGRRRR